MSTGKRRGGYLATVEGVKKLKAAKSQKKYTYAEIQKQIPVTLDQVKRLFNPQWGNGQYKIGEDAVSLICGVLDLAPEDVVDDWHALKTEEGEEKTTTPYKKALQLIEQADKIGARQLYLVGMRLTELPAEIAQLTDLLLLDLRENSLSSLPSEIGQLANLSALYLQGNNLSSLPSEIGRLTNLSVLALSGNNLGSLPSEIGRLTNLSVLALSGNNLSSLPSEIEQLTNLFVLGFGGNSLGSLPSEITQLTNLALLDLRKNSLGSLPSEIGQLTNLSLLYLQENSLSIPPEVLEKIDEPATIINYYLSLQNSQKPLHEAKMLLVGQGNVGKTCVKERLLRNQYDSARSKTNGIDVEPLEIAINQNIYQINVWDFGGQEIMHSTHQFFLTKRSLYLLVLDVTMSEGENRIEYWLKIIQSFGQDSPVIIVGNKTDQHPLDLDRRGLQNKYSQIKGFYEVSCANATGIEELKDKVIQEISQLDHIDDALPLPWFNVKQKLEALDKDYISFEQYESICEVEEISESNNQRVLIGLLNDLGIVLNFHDDPRLTDTHVLNPEWVTNGVYKILNNAELIRDYKGILELNMLQSILNSDRYPTGKQMFIMDMMRKFELCFDIEANQKFLIPDLLPKGEPDTGNWDNTLAFEYHYPVYINSIISRFIVRMHEWISKHTYWRTGVVLAKEGNRALIKANREDKKIIIRVTGRENTRRNLLTAIRSDFEHIHSTIPGIIPIEKVPLLDFPHIPPVDYQWLFDLYNKGVRTTYVPGLTEEIDIRQLLNGIASKIDREDRARDDRFKGARTRTRKPPENHQKTQ